jgi:anaphase-promoting complex subunit 5
MLIRQCRSDWSTSTHLLETLKPTSSHSTPPLDPELSFFQHDTYIEYLISTSQFSLAYQCVSSLAQSLKEDNADIQQRVSVLLMQAELWRKAGKPERGFSVALRAASVSFRARLASSLWAAVGCLGAILNTLGECREAKRLVEAVLPQVRDFPLFTHSGVAHTDVYDRLWRAQIPCS